MSRIKLIGIAVAVVSVLATGLYINHLQGQVGQARQEALDANVRAATFEAQYDEALGATKELALQAGSAIHLSNQLRRVNAELAQHLEEAESTILVLEETVVELRTELVDSESEVVHEEGESEITVQVRESVAFRGGGSLTVEGVVKLTATPAPDLVEQESISLGASGSFPLTIVLSRSESGDIEVHASTGDDRIRVSAIDVTTNLEDAGANAEAGFFSAIAATLAEQAVGIGPWINRGLGFLACRIIG